MTSRTPGSETHYRILWVHQKATLASEAQEEYDALLHTLRKTKLQCRLMRALNRQWQIGIQMPTAIWRTWLMKWYLLIRGYRVRKVEMRSERTYDRMA